MPIWNIKLGRWGNKYTWYTTSPSAGCWGLPVRPGYDAAQGRVVDLSFRLIGGSISADHGYALYSAICRIVPALHGSGEETNGGAVAPAGGSVQPLWREVGIHPVNGNIMARRRISITPRSRLTLRLPSDRIVQVLSLAGKELVLGADRLRVGVPRAFPLHSVARLCSRLVTIKGFLEADPFLAAVRRQLDLLGIRGESVLLRRHGDRTLEGKAAEAGRSSFLRRTLRVRDKEIVGYAVEVSGLSVEESICLQESGLGGRRRFGCGLFVPMRDATP